MKDAFIIGIFLLIASFLYYYYLPLSDFWLDEVIPANLINLKISLLIKSLLVGEAHPPLYYLGLKFWSYIFGDNESALRFFSFLFFFPTIIAIYFFTRKIFDEATARFSLALSSTSYFLIWYAHQVRMYEMTAFLSAASFACLYGLFKKFSYKTALAYVVFTIMGLYTHYWFVLLFVAQCILILVWAKKIEFKKIFSVLFLTGLAFLPWAILYLLKFEQYSGATWMEKSSLNLFWQSFKFFSWEQWFIIIPASLLGLIILIKTGGTEKIGAEKDKFIFLLCYLFIPLILAYIISKFFPIYTPGRREIVVLPAFIILISYLFSRIRFKYWFWAASLLLIVFSNQAIIKSNKYTSGHNANDKFLIQEVANRLKNNDTVVLYGASGASFDYYFYREPVANSLMINKIYFPPEMKKFPGAIDLVLTMADDEKKQTENFSWLDNKLKKTPSDNIYVFTNDDTLYDRISSFFNEGYKQVGTINSQEPRMASWFNKILIYKTLSAR